MRQIFSFEGRSNRKFFSIFSIVTWIGLYPERVLVDLAIHTLDPNFPLGKVPIPLRSVTLSNGVALVVTIAGALVLGCMLIAGLSLLVRRFHDFNLSGWFVILAFALTLPVPDLGMDRLGLPPLATLIWMSVMVIVPGSRGPNRYGNPPGTTTSLREG